MRFGLRASRTIWTTGGARVVNAHARVVKAFAAVPDQVTHPVCGMTVNSAAAQYRHDHEGKHSISVPDAVGKSSIKRAQYALRKAPPARRAPCIPRSASQALILVRSAACMALEPERETLEPAVNPELVDMRRRLLIALALTFPMFTLEMGSLLKGLHQWLGKLASNWVQLALVTRRREVASGFD